MKRMKLFAGVAALAAATLALGACTDDDYTSTMPAFSGMTLESLTGDGSIYVGRRAVATACQSTQGRLLNGTTYSWSISPSDSVEQKYTSGVIYDYDPSNPTDTLLFKRAGSYKLTLTAAYKPSGDVDYSRVGSTVTTSDGTTVNYRAASIYKYEIVVSKTFRVFDAP